MDPDWFGEKKYTGTFDGNGHVIRGLYIERESEEYVGLFGALGENGSLGEYGTVENVGLEDFYIKGDRIVGGVVARNYGTVSNVYSMSSVSGDYHVGGVIGNADCSSRVGKCAFHNVLSYSVVSVIEGALKKYYLGGVFGRLMDSTVVENAYYISDLNKFKAAGGFTDYDTGEAYGMTTTELANGTLPEGFSEDVWDVYPFAQPVQKDGKWVYMLPRLKVFSSETYPEVASDAFLIGSADDLKAFAKMVNEDDWLNGKLVKDICLNACKDGDKPVLTQIASLKEGKKYPTLALNSGPRLVRRKNRIQEHSTVTVTPFADCITMQGISMKQSNIRACLALWEVQVLLKILAWWTPTLVAIQSLAVWSDIIMVKSSTCTMRAL